MRYCILIRKLGFLWRLLNPKRSTISVEVFNSLKDQDPGPLIIDQCKFLEQVYNTNYTASLLNDDTVSLKSLKKALKAADDNHIWKMANKHNSLKCLSRSIMWPRLWDMARDHGIQGSRSLSAIFKIFTTPIFEEWSCPFCATPISRVCTTFAEHVATVHLSQPLANIVSLLEEGDDELFSVGAKIKALYASTPCQTVS